MTVIILKNNKEIKCFRKFFPCFVLSEMMEWAEEKFPKAKKRVIDRGVNQIRIYY